ncbi:hypothetical protein BpHYR1_054429 [Brachionus plicatilis]|uniref:Uncharacterized protein n=1 Tax=Brachionus plicatilis TaxID=10195 RepID=A0A3M7QGW4_BRAPC|nr:hypothetical protein BpHYR1_054429 [Brachionus plicatilis]
MKILNYFFCLIVLVDQWLYINNTNLDGGNSFIQNKCSAQVKVSSSFDLIVDGFEFMSDLTNFLGALNIISRIEDKIFDQNSISNCDLSNQLDRVINKLENLESVVRCVWHSHYYRELLSKIEHLIDAYKQHALKPRNSTLIKFQKQCQSESEGISKIYSLIKMLFKENELLDNIENCCHYKTKLYTILFRKLISLSTLFLTALKFCEESLNKKSDFEPKFFYNDVENVINYFTKDAILQRFVTDKGAFGLESSIKRLANKSVSLSSFQDDYDFFRWKVVYVIDSSFACYSENAWKMECTSRYASWTDFSSIFCGSMHDFNEVGSQRIHALVAWCHKEKEEVKSTNKVLDDYNGLNERRSILNYVISQTNDANKRINFAITILKGSLFFNWMNPVESHGGMNYKRTSKWFHGTYDTYWSEWYPKQSIGNYQKFRNFAIIFRTSPAIFVYLALTITKNTKGY